MKVKLISPPAIQSQIRGAGFYGNNLTQGLRNIKELEIIDVDPDLTHFLYFDPFFLTLPIVRKTKTIVTVFDLTPIVLKDLFNPGVRGEIKWQIQKQILKTVDAIITISQSAKNDIVKYAGISPKKIFVTYLAAGKACKPMHLKRDNSVVFIGDINENKNISGLLKAVSLLKQEKLILVGKALAESKAISDKIKSLGIENRVTLTGFVSEEEKAILLNKAKVYVQPSIYEGFGLPIIEAMACGTPVICGNNSSLPEVAGKAATYADVTDPKDLAEKISKIKPDEKECLAQANKFSWEKAAKETYEIYQKVLSGI